MLTLRGNQSVELHFEILFIRVVGLALISSPPAAQEQLMRVLLNSENSATKQRCLSSYNRLIYINHACLRFP